MICKEIFINLHSSIHVLFKMKGQMWD